MAVREEPLAARRVAIVQARMGSTRLPGKVLADIAGKPMLQRVLERAARARRVHDVAVATSTAPADAEIARLCEALGVPVFRGEEQDVLDRYRQAARALGADVVVRVTGDCPLLDPAVADLVVEAFEREPGADFATNTLVRTYPQGLDVEVASLAVLERAWAEAKEPYERAHVFPYVYRHPEIFRLVGVTAPRDRSGWRWTVDTPEDLEFVRAVYARLADELAGWAEVEHVIEAEPALLELNRAVRQKALEEG